jgi:2-keto-4-pentenoate hydratase/2-oxohepta-3-ene-1,7-dioic acid hydratase in catechol pathway
MDSRTALGVRIFRVEDGGERLWLARAGHLWDLSARLEEHGRAPDLLELARDGWLAAEHLQPLLPDDEHDRGWKLVESAWDGNAPEQVLTPLARASVGKVLALGKNFRAHAHEFDEEVPEEPLFFNKLPECLVPHRAAVRPPRAYRGRLDHEAELTVVIGRDGADSPAEEALEHVAGWSLANDLTLRSLQGADRGRKHPWFRSKNFDGACPFGPAFVPRDFLDPTRLRVRARVGRLPRQDASTADLVIDIPHAIAHLSAHLRLRAGDLILMGTPAGVGALEDGDEVTCSIEGIGDLTTRIQRERPSDGESTQ